MKLTIEYHAGNPNLCRIPELRIKAMPECEGGGWFIPREQAEYLIRAAEALAKSEAALPCHQLIQSPNPGATTCRPQQATASIFS